MSRIWQLRSLEEKLSTNSAGSRERLYERFSINRQDMFCLTMKGHTYQVVSIAYGGLAFYVPLAEKGRLTEGYRIEGVLSLWGIECPLSARCVSVRDQQNQVLVAAQFLYDSIDLMDFLRAYMPFMRLGFYLASEPCEGLTEEIDFDLNGVEQIDFDAELAVQRNANGLFSSVVFTYGNAQIAVSYSDKGGFASYKNLGVGGEMSTFAKSNELDTAILRKAVLLYIGFLTQAEVESDIRTVLDKACDQLKLQTPIAPPLKLSG